MFLLLKIVLFVVAFGLLIPSTVLFLECLAAVLPNPSDIEETRQPLKCAVLIPAHNEASEIKTTLTTLLPQVATPGCIVVIADNCTDKTAAIARQFGVTVIERQDSQQRGKGYALDYGLKFLEANPPDVVVVIDADCLVELGTIERLVQVAQTSGKPVQATYLIEHPPYPGTKDLISALAVLVKNLVRPKGLARLKLPCLLTGTGMAFPWSVIQKVSLASGNIVEDMHLGIDLALAGHAPRFCSEAKVTGILPQQKQAATTQRTRWEHGHLQTLLTQVPRLLQAAIRQRRFELFALGLELGVPPLSLLVMVWGIALSIALLTGALSSVWSPVLILGLVGLLMNLAIIVSWAKFGRADFPGLSLLAIPFYLLWKIPLYFAFLGRPQAEWIRTERDTKESSS